MSKSKERKKRQRENERKQKATQFCGMTEMDEQAAREGQAVKEHRLIRPRGPEGYKIVATRRMISAGERKHDNRIDGRYLTK